MATTIAIKSEVDSRVLLYPFLKAIHNYGSICVISSNKQITRLVNGEFEGECRGMRIIYDMDGATDDTLELYQIGPGDYDFYILDNAVAWEYDALFLILGQRQTPSFDTDVLELLDDKRTFIFQYGKADGKSSTRDKGVRAPKSAGHASFDSSEDYWQKLAESSGSMDKVMKAKESNRFIVPWPAYSDIEMVEGTWKFPQAFPSELVTPLHSALQPFIGVDIQYFMKEVKRADESGGNLKYRNSTRP